MTIDSVSSKITSDDIKQLVIERLRRIPPGKKVSIGSNGDYTSQELIKLVESNDKVGDKVIEMELEYLRSLKNLLGEN